MYDTDEFLTDLGTTKSVFVDNDYLITAASGSLGKISKLNISGYIYDGLMCMCFKNTSLEMPLSEQRRIVEKQRELFDKITLI